MSGPGLPILTLHSLADDVAPTSFPLSCFVKVLERLLAAGFVGVDLAEWIGGGRPAVERGFAVTFDDGLRSIVPGLECLGRLGLPATVFLVTDYVGRDNDWPGQPSWVPREATLDWPEVEDWARRGVAFGAHSRTHPRLDKVPIAAVEREVRGSADAIAARLGTPCRLFAYPYGAATRAVQDRCLSFDAAFSTRLACATSHDDLFNLPRIDAYYLRSPRVMDRLIHDRLGPWLAACGALRTARRAAGSIAARALR